MKTNSKDIAILDYGCSNIESIMNAVEFNGYRPKLTNDLGRLSKFNKIILPGVGHFRFAMKSINELNLKKFIKLYIEQNNHLLAICLGMQLLLSKSRESNNTKGLEIFNNNVLKIKNKKNHESYPHISFKKIFAIKKTNLLNGIKKNDYFYFIHSYYCNVIDKKKIIAKTKYNNEYFPSIINYKNCYGVQFHPEKSKLPGLKLIDNFLNM